MKVREFSSVVLKMYCIAPFPWGTVRGSTAVVEEKEAGRGIRTKCTETFAWWRQGMLAWEAAREKFENC